MSEAAGLASPPGWDCHLHLFDRDVPVVPGHYQPEAAELPMVEAIARPHGIGHLVLVQPSVYGSDNRVLLGALRSEPGRHRGVVVIDDSADEASLTSMHALGVRGVRVNLVSPVGRAADPVGVLKQRVATLRALGWHIQWYLGPQDLPALAARTDLDALPCVLDHLAGLPEPLEADDARWRALGELARRGAWIKLSGWYRLGDRPPYPRLRARLPRLWDLFEGRLLWGSDWPHTSFARHEAPDYASQLAPLSAGLDPAKARDILRIAPSRLYR